MASSKTPVTAPNVNINNADMVRKELLKTYQGEALVERSVSPLYEPYLGKVLQISINGITIAFPINGTIHKVPQSFADEIDSRVMAIDATLNKAKKMSDIGSNAESYPGQLQMF